MPESSKIWGVPVVKGGQNLPPPPVGIWLIDLPKIEGASTPGFCIPAPQLHGDTVTVFPRIVSSLE